MIRRRTAWLAAAGGIAVLTAGCGAPNTTVSGSVTYDGQPVNRGWLTFQPADGKGPSAGAEIAGGKYAVKAITPGQKKVQIVGVKSVPFARSSEEMAKMAATAARAGDDSGLIDPADEIPPTAEGNNTAVELKSGAQTLDFQLKKPAAKP